MKIEDIDKEFKELARIMKDGQLSFVAGRFSEAEPLYREALELLEKSHGEEHSDIAICLQNLADCYYALRKYADAIPHLRRLLIIKEKHLGVSHPDVAAVLFKLAKAYEKTGKPRESESFYRRALKVGEQACGPNHLFVATILESFSAMLRRAHMRLAEAAEMEERLREIRAVAAQPKASTLTNAIEKLAASIPPGQLTEGDADVVAEQDISGRYAASEAKPATDNVGDNSNIGSLKSATNRLPSAVQPPPALRRPKLSFVLALSVAVLAVCGLAVFLVAGLSKNPSWLHTVQAILPYRATKDMPSANTAKEEQLEFATVDHQKQLSIRADRQAVLLRNGVVMKGAVEVSDDAVIFTPRSQSIGYRFRRTASALIDDDNSALYAADAPETYLAQRMNVLAAVLQAYYRQLNTYPKQTDDILSGDQHIIYKNPFTAKETIPLRKRLSPAAEMEPEDLQAMDIAELQGSIQKLLTDTGVKEDPGTIEWYRVRGNPEGDSVFICATGRDGKPIQGSRPGLIYFIRLVAGNRRS